MTPTREGFIRSVRLQRDKVPNFKSYAKREAVAGAQQKRALAVLTGGRLAS